MRRPIQGLRSGNRRVAAPFVPSAPHLREDRHSSGNDGMSLSGKAPRARRCGTFLAATAIRNTKYVSYLKPDRHRIRLNQNPMDCGASFRDANESPGGGMVKKSGFCLYRDDICGESRITKLLLLGLTRDPPPVQGSTVASGWGRAGWARGRDRATAQDAETPDPLRERPARPL